MQNEERINVLEGKVKELEELVQTLKEKNCSDVIRAKGFIVEDEDGNELAQLTMTDDGGHLSISNKYGRQVAGLGANEDGGLMGIYNKYGEKGHLRTLQFP